MTPSQSITLYHVSEVMECLGGLPKELWRFGVYVFCSTLRSCGSQHPPQFNSGPRLDNFFSSTAAVPPVGCVMGRPLPGTKNPNFPRFGPFLDFPDFLYGALPCSVDLY